jgi:glycerophosphoryl diester phosphodiesterase
MPGGERPILPGLQRPILVAHGGGAAAAGGDVAAGVERAIADGAGMIEIDVRRTADGVLVVHHGTVAGDEGVSARRFADVESPAIPALRDILERAAGRVAVNLELKETGFEADAIALGREVIGADRLLVTSFLDPAVAAAGRAAPDVATGLIVGRAPARVGVRGVLEDVFPFARVRACGARALASSRPLDFTGMRWRASRRAIPALVWTINDARALNAALADPRLLGVVTDRCDLRSRPSDG